MAENKKFYLTTGRRKSAVARVKMVPSAKATILVNGKDFTNYFPTIDQQMQIKKAFEITDTTGKFRVTARVNGGGVSGQAGAVSLGIARALVEMNPELRSPLRKSDLLTRDPRAKERKKYGRKGARKRFQWTKR